MAAPLWILLIAGFGLLVNPGDTQLINEFSQPDFLISENYLLEIESGSPVIVPNPKKLKSGSIEFLPSNSLSDSQLISTDILFNGASQKLPKGRVTTLDNFISTRYTPSGGSRLGSQSTCPEAEKDGVCPVEEIIVPGGIRSMTKTYELFHEDNLLELGFSDSFNILPFNQQYTQKLVVKNNYPLNVAGRVSYKVTGSAVADVEPPIQHIDLILTPGDNAVEINIPSTLFEKDSDIIGKSLDAQVRLVYDYGNFNDFAVVPFEAVSRDYKFKPNIKSPEVSVEKKVTRTKFFSSGKLPKAEQQDLKTLQDSVNEGGSTKNTALFLITIAGIVGFFIINR